jgi:hypothetical protein
MREDDNITSKIRKPASTRRRAAGSLQQILLLIFFGSLCVLRMSQVFMEYRLEEESNSNSAALSSNSPQQQQQVDTGNTTTDTPPRTDGGADDDFEELIWNFELVIAGKQEQDFPNLPVFHLCEWYEDKTHPPRTIRQQRQQHHKKGHGYYNITRSVTSTVMPKHEFLPSTGKL